MSSKKKKKKKEKKTLPPCGLHKNCEVIRNMESERNFTLNLILTVHSLINTCVNK